MVNKHSFQYSELSRHPLGSIHLKYIELIVICLPCNMSNHSLPLNESHIKKYYLVLQKKLEFIICITKTRIF